MSINDTNLKTLVSIVIPSYNHSRYILEAIRSVLNQTYRDIECIVIDDGSTDNSIEIIKNSFSCDKRLKLFHRENKGAHVTINEAIRKANGDYIGILNSDDVYDIDRIEKFMNLRHEVDGPFLFISELRIIDADGEINSDCAQYNYYSKIKERMINLPDQKSFLAGNLAMTTSNFFFSRSAYELVGDFRNLRYTHDWDWALRASELCTIRRIKSTLMSYRVHNSNTISESNLWKHIAENSVIFASKLLRDRINNKFSDDEKENLTPYYLLLRNESFLPIPVLMLSNYGVSDTDLIDKLSNGHVESYLQENFARCSLSLDLFLSANHISGKLHREFSKPRNSFKNKLLVKFKNIFSTIKNAKY